MANAGGGEGGGGARGRSRGGAARTASGHPSRGQAPGCATRQALPRGPRGAGAVADGDVRGSGVRDQVGIAVGVQLLEASRHRQGAAEQWQMGGASGRCRHGAPRPGRRRRGCGLPRGRCRSRRGRRRRPRPPTTAPRARAPRAQPSRCRSAARRTYACWPRLTGRGQPRTPRTRRSWYLSACAVPATSQRRRHAASGWRAGRYRAAVRSVSVCTRSPARRGRRGRGRVVAEARQGHAPPGSPSGIAAPPRLWTRKPSKTRSSGCTPLTYVVSAYADCDSPTASAGRTSTSSGPAGERTPARHR